MVNLKNSLVDNIEPCCPIQYPLAIHDCFHLSKIALS